MTQHQFELVKMFLDDLHVPPLKLGEAWGIVTVDVFRVSLCANYEVYKNDQTPDEDVLLVMLGVEK